MPPRTRITREMIVGAAIEVVRQKGFENVNARTVAKELRCSTQPVMYHFETVENLKRAAYREADRMHSEYMIDVPKDQDPILGIGLNYIRFAVNEPQLFRFLFQSGYAEESNLLEMIDSEELAPVLSAMQEGSGMGPEQTKNVFLTVALFAHGYASIIANNGLEYDEKLIAEHLTRAWNGAVLASQEEKL
ncbi:MAG: TetR/AcrR family transcriptional regulator [Lachnospiraceae bacterium]|nr:TetR/AcrR family transcriptional regulator [Lachnospiraceae bacterium]